MSTRGWLLVLSGFVAPALAWGDADRAIGGEVAVVGSASRDDLLVPHAQSGGGLALGFEYLGRAGPGVLDVAARLGAVAGADRLGAMGLAIEHGIGLRYCLPLPSLGAWRLAVGPAAGTDSDILYLREWDDTHAYWMGSTWLGAAARGWRPLGGGWRLDGAGELGLVGFVSRPPEERRNKQDAFDWGYFFVDVHDDPSAVWLGNWQLARVRLELSRARGEGFATSAWRFGVEARMARAADPQPAFALSLKLVAAKAWGW